MPRDFRGQAYADTDTATTDAARRFTTTSTKLRWAAIQITTNTQLFGDSSTQVASYAAGTSFEIEDVDISTLYFKNAGAGSNGTVSIVGVLAD